MAIRYWEYEDAPLKEKLKSPSPAVLFANAKAGRQEKRRGKHAEANTNEAKTAQSA